MKLKWFSASGQGELGWTFFWCCWKSHFSGGVLKHEIEIETINTRSMIYNTIGNTDFMYELEVNWFVQNVDIFI